MGRAALLAVAIFAPMLIPRQVVSAGVTDNPNQTARAVDSHADIPHSGGLLNDFFAAPVVRNLILRNIVVGLGAAYDTNFVGDLPRLEVYVNQGSNTKGVSYLNIAKAELPSTHKGVPVDFSNIPVAAWSTTRDTHSLARNGKPSDKDIEHAQKALLNFSAMPGVRELIRKRMISEVAVNYTISPPELFVGANLKQGESLEEVERQVPVHFEGFPVLLTFSQRFQGTTAAFGAFGTDPKRPGRAKLTNQEQ